MTDGIFSYLLHGADPSGCSTFWPDGLLFSGVPSAERIPKRLISSSKSKSFGSGVDICIRGSSTWAYFLKKCFLYSKNGLWTMGGVCAIGLSRIVLSEEPESITPGVIANGLSIL